MSLQPQTSQKRNFGDLVAVPIDLVPRDQRLQFPLYVRVAGSPVLLRTEGDTLTGERAARLKEKTPNVFVPQSSFDLFLDALEAGGSVRGAGLASSPSLRDLLASLADGFSKSKELQVRTLKQIENFADGLADVLIRHPSAAQSLIRKSDDSGLYFSNHNLNVAVYSALVGIKQGLAQAAIRKLVLGSILHNVGNIFVSPGILYKAGSLSKDERELIETHPIAGSELLHSLGVSRDIVLMVLQHHERMDGQGYPYAIAGNRVSLFARICSIADVFDALTSHRPYRAAVSPATAIGMMREMTGKFDPAILSFLER